MQAYDGSMKIRPVNVVSGVDGFSIARGEVANTVIKSKFGRNSLINIASAPADVWNGGGIYTGFPDGAAETIEVFSSDAADTDAGTGLRTIRLYGLLNGVEQTEDVVLNGVTPVATTKLWNRMNRMIGLTAGSTGGNVGQITARHTTTTANVFAVMPTGNRTQIAAVTIPDNCTCYLSTFVGKIVRASGAAGSADMAIMVREPGGLWQQRQTYAVSTGSDANVDFQESLTFPGGTDIVARVLSVSDNGTIATAQFTYKCVADGS